MTEIFRAKVRRIGTSAGVLISNEKLKQEGIHIGDEIKLTILPTKKDLSGFGIAKNFKIKFRRDKKTRNL